MKVDLSRANRKKKSSPVSSHTEATSHFQPESIDNVVGRHIDTMSQITSQVGALLAPLLFIILLVTESLEAGALQSKLRLHSRAIRATPDSMPANQIHQPVTSKQSYSKIPSMNGDTMMMNQPMIDERGGNDGSPIVESHNIEAEIFSPLRDLEKKGFVDSVIYNPLKVIEMLNTLMHDIAWSVLMKVNR